MGAAKNFRLSRRCNGSSVTSDPHQPAFEGAKFDVSGHCLKHPRIRLCKPKELTCKKKGDQPELKYVIVRKTCHLCGEHALCNERKLNKKTWAHGYEPAKLEKRKGVPGDKVGTDIHIKMNTGHGVSFYLLYVLNDHSFH